ncbi:hypothetical protein L2X99_14190 [Microbacterium sp. KUDC0406]|uniref:hypothetical protein n=1 Tax=Microbacterium sp. KUDC0406 TaxID=2909588 RepID=UPI001F3B7A67|nr:hypothetical protein [Microbacterium sp. KUDC0406]UJP09555.1 hypothetical protein L2X99_14190 [Microbacterium sp. KUDC0406]
MTSALVFAVFGSVSAVPSGCGAGLSRFIDADLAVDTVTPVLVSSDAVFHVKHPGILGSSVVWAVR